MDIEKEADLIAYKAKTNHQIFNAVLRRCGWERNVFRRAWVKDILTFDRETQDERCKTYEITGDAIDYCTDAVSLVGVLRGAAYDFDISVTEEVRLFAAARTKTIKNLGPLAVAHDLA